MTDEELSGYTARQQALLDRSSPWLFGDCWGEEPAFRRGIPHAGFGKSLLLQAGYIVVGTLRQATSVDELTYAITSCRGTGIPAGNFVVTVSTGRRQRHRSDRLLWFADGPFRWLPSG